MSRWIALAVSISLSGCASFLAPPYEEGIADKLTMAATGVEKIGAALDLEDRPATTYPDFEEQYVDILADLRSAQTIAEGRAAIYSERPAGKAASAIVQMIRNCDQAVLRTALQHKQHGLTGSLFKDAMTQQICSLSVKGEKLLPPS